jgi:hypothetical protein
MRFFVKSVSLAILMVAALCACDSDTTDYDKLVLERDSLQIIQKNQLEEMEMYLTLIQEVDSAFDEIRISQDILSFASYDTENPSDEMRKKVADNIIMINTLLSENQFRIAELEEMLANSEIQSTQLQRKVNKLTADLRKRTQEVTDLRNELISKNYQIDSLTVMFRMSQDREALLIKQASERDSILQSHEAQLNRAYFFVGNRRTLRDNDINVKDRDSGYRTELFTPVDIRHFDHLEIGSKSAKVLTKHPETSYEIVDNSDKTKVLVIKNATDFWSVSRYLIIQTR